MEHFGRCDIFLGENKTVLQLKTSSTFKKKSRKVIRKKYNLLDACYGRAALHSIPVYRIDEIKKSQNFCSSLGHKFPISID